MSAKVSRRGKRYRLVRRRSTCLTPQRKVILWGLVGVVFAGLFLLMSNINSAPNKQVRRSAVKKAKPALVVLEKSQPKSTTASDVALEESSSVVPSPEPERKENETDRNMLAANDNEDNASEEPDKSMPVGPPPVDIPTVATDDAAKPRKYKRLTETNENGDQYIDMATGTLLFTENASLNDENLDIYLERVMDRYESQEYDQEGAERQNENKQVR